jgi:hypothetical protein
VEERFGKEITSPFFSTADSTTSDEICLSAPNIKMVVPF